MLKKFDLSETSKQVKKNYIKPEGPRNITKQMIIIDRSKYQLLKNSLGYQYRIYGIRILF
jgi:hypothetical protein